MSLSSSPEQPQPLRRIVTAVRDWVGRCGEIWVEAQLVEIKRRTAPTQFLTFRDKHADMSAQATASSMVLDAAGPLPEGSEVTARVRPRVWERNSSLRFECLELRVAGEGQLLARLEQLKRTLQAEGLFDAHRKRRLPLLPRGIGVITGKDSDAERDVVSNVVRRWPSARLHIQHAVVQGPTSAESVTNALHVLDENPMIDVIILARGGGSLSDLLSFSDEALVRAVAAAHTPIVTAIGHERDTPVVDLVADVRASTPTDAAKLVVPDHRAESAGVAEARSRLRAAMQRRLAEHERQLHDLRTRPVLANPASAFTAHEEHLALLRHRLRSATTRRLDDESARILAAVSTVRALSPKRTLERGYAILVDGQQRSVSSTRDTSAGARIHAWLADGQLTLDVAETKEHDD